jgi:poly-gamma-glutamate synthesis protein (capsule biosynthesis protein)
LPSPIIDTLQASLAVSPGGDGLAPSADGADVRVVLDPGPGDAVIGEAVYAVVAPFPALIDDVAWADVRSTWLGVASGPFAPLPLLVSPHTAAALAARLGDPSPSSVEIVPSKELLQRAWDSRPSWAIVPFDLLEPRWKVLRLDGHSVLDRRMDLASYPLAVRIALRGHADDTRAIRQLIASPVTNWDRARMSVVAMTGVTALARGTGMRIDWYGPAYPIEDIAEWLLEPDITHISSEVSFAEDCPPPADYTTTVFCSSPRYIELLELLDIDIIELTGNHLLDWGVGAMELSLRMYDERGLPYFGGGWNLAQAQTPLTITAGVHTFAFVGCNPVGPRSDWATADLPGSAPCDYDLLYDQIRALRREGMIPIATLQYREAYQYEPLPQQRVDFGALAEAGAVIVSGSQAHQPQGFAFEHGAFIHYGLGNLFFDQMWSLETRQEFVDRHVFYDGRHISTEVLTAILEDYARPRPMTPAERALLLRAAFAASGW